MSVGKICVREVWTAESGETIRAAARRMVEGHVGSLVVLDDGRKPIGILTDRDAITRCIADGLNADTTTVGELMSSPVTMVREGTPIEDALEQMASCHVGRMPVVDDRGHLVGILALDDVIDLIAEETTTLGRLLRNRR